MANKTMSEWKNDVGLRPQQARALELITSTTNSLPEIADKVGVNKSQLYRWLSDDDNFRLQLDTETTAIISSATRQMVFLYAESVKVIDEAMQEGNTVSGQRLRAADLVVKRLPALLEMTLLHVRLTQLEQKLTAQGIEIPEAF